MDSTIASFLNAGRALRARCNAAHMIALEADPFARMCLKKWAVTMGRDLAMCSTPEMAEAVLGHRGGILIIGADGFSRNIIEGFILRMDAEKPSAYILVHTENPSLAYGLQTSMPRITTITKGAGISDLMAALNHEVPVKEACVGVVV